MVTLRGAVGQSFTATSNTINLPGGSAAGDWAALFVSSASTLTSDPLTTIKNWIAPIQSRTSTGVAAVYFKQLTAADITAGSVTVTYAGSAAGFTAIAVAQSNGSGFLRIVDNDGYDTTFTTGRTDVFDVKNGEVGIYVGIKRKSGSTPSVSFNVGTLDNANAVSGSAGAVAHTSYGSDQTITLTSTWDSAGQYEVLYVFLFTDTGRASGPPSDAATYFAFDYTDTFLLYKGRATAVDDAAGVP